MDPIRYTLSFPAPHTHYVHVRADTLVDSPILVGNPEVYEFSVDGTPHLLANVGDTGFFDAERAVNDLQAIARAHKEFWGSFPYDASPARISARSGDRRSKAPTSSITGMRSMCSDYSSGRSLSRQTADQRHGSAQPRRWMADVCSWLRSSGTRPLSEPASMSTTSSSRLTVCVFARIV